MSERTRRIGLLGGVTIVLLAAFGILALVRLTSRAQPPHRCSGGAALPAGVTADSATEAIRRFVPQARPPAYLGEAVGEIPDDGWVRRSDLLYEHDAAGSRTLQIDLASADGRTTVTGLWLCSPV